MDRFWRAMRSHAVGLGWHRVVPSGLGLHRLLVQYAGKYVPSLLLAFRLATAFGVRVEDVFQYEGGPSS